ncbi:hypothetical protein Sjap_009085 [Stephania japonica]|uniref:CCHC-type domain-containing protein n=1 Tax=Stephania japonica TaxID=461633 RepID=A0AAP0PF37_9MAGN
MATQAVISGPKETAALVNLAYVAQGRNRGKGQSQCYSCKEFGHIARNCTKKFCNYCKQQGHIINECPTRPENQKAQAFQAVVSSSTVNDGVFTTANANQPTLTPEMVQQMILTTFSALELQGNSKPTTFPWIVDSGASNHMIGSTNLLHNIREYTGTQSIEIANGSNLPITAIGDITPSFRHVFVSPGLSTSLISVGQMVDNNCDVHVSRNGCLVQDQVSGKVIAKGPKVGKPFCLNFVTPT